MRAAEDYPGDPDRWGLDAVFWWPRLYTVLPEPARAQVDAARDGLDQMVVLAALAGLFLPPSSASASPDYHRLSGYGARSAQPR